jgi:hypothetical protein
MKRVLVAITAVLCISGNVFAYSGLGDGSAGNPYQIENVADFQQLSTTPADWNKSFILTADINLTGLTFINAPIAPDTITDGPFQGTPFTGIFDGKGHVISYLTITTSTQYYIGLFGKVGSGSQIRNLGVENVNITGYFFVGGLVGVNNGTVTACYATGSVSGTSDYVGGLVGENNGSSLTGCYATGSVSGANYIGGLAGVNYEGSITSCYATSSVTGTGYDVGGLVGYNGRSFITSCYATGSVSGTGSIGGLVGVNNDSSLTGCFWDTQTCLPVTVGIGYGQPSTGVIGKMTVEMKTLSTFTDANWDFVNTWWMPDGNYPHLISLSGPFTLYIQTTPPFITSISPPVGQLTVFGTVDISAMKFSQCPDIYNFDHWEGEGILDPNSSQTTVIMDQDKTIIAVFIDARKCGDECHPYPSMDFNQDCRVNLADFTMFAVQWMECTTPECD